MWHKRIGHLGVQNLKKLQSMSTSLDLSYLPHEDYTCEACLRGRIKDTPHQDSLAKNTKLYKVIFSNVEGPMSVIGHKGS